MHCPWRGSNRLFADELERQGELVFDLLVGISRNTDATRLGERFQPRRDIDSVAVDGVFVYDHVPQIDADAELHPLIVGELGVFLGQFPLNLRSGRYSIDDAYGCR